MVILVRKSTGELLTSSGATYYGQARPADLVPARSSVAVSVGFIDDNGNPTLLNPAKGTLSFTAQPAPGDTFAVGATTYTATATLPTATADEVLLGPTVAAFVANLVGAISGANSNGQGSGTTYSATTTANPLVVATASGTKIIFTASAADATGNTVATSTTSAAASFGASTLTGGPTLSLSIKPQGEYDAAAFTLPSPIFTAPANPATGYYTGTLITNTTQANALLDPNNVDGTTPNAIEPDNEPLMAQLSWGVPGTLPVRSGKWQITLDNSVEQGGEGVPINATPSLSVAALEAAITQAADAEPGLGEPTSDGSILSSLANGARSWLATSTFGRTLLGIADAVSARAALGLGSAATSNVSAFDASGAAANAQAAAVQRANHTGTQPATTITGLAAVSVSGSASDLITGTLDPSRLPATVPLLADLGSGSPIDLNILGAILQSGNVVAYQGNIFYGNGNQLTNGYGNLYYGNGSLLADNSGFLYGDGSNLTNVPTPTGVLNNDNGLISSDGDGNLTTQSLNAGGVRLNDGNVLLTPGNPQGPLSIYTDGTSLYFVDQNAVVNVLNMTPTAISSG